MKYLLLVIAFALLVGCSNELPYEGQEARLTVPAWEEGLAYAYAVAAVLEEEYGFDATVTLLDVDEAFAAVANGEQDAMMEVWLPHLHADYWTLYNGQLEAVGSLFTGARLGLAVPNHSVDDGIVALSDLDSVTVANRFGNEMHALSDSGVDEIEDEVFPHYLTSAAASWSATRTYMTDIEARLPDDFDNKTDIVFEFMQPSRLFGQFELQMLEQDGPIIWEADEIRIAIASDLAARKPGLASILSSVTFTNDEANAMIAEFSEYDLGYETRASQWKAKNPGVWADW